MRGLIRRFPSIKSIKNKYRAIGYRKQKDNEIFLLFDLNNTEILIPNKKEFQNDESDISPLTTGNKKSILAILQNGQKGLAKITISQ